MNLPKFTNETMLERITAYVQLGLYEQAEALVFIGDQLEENFHWELGFLPQGFKQD